MTPPPGTRVHRLIRPWLTATVSIDVLDPAVADLQFEAGRARTAGERRKAIRRGYAAIVRALLLSIEPAGAIRATVALGALCALGALLVTTTRAAGVETRVLESAILAPGMLAPAILRILGTTASRRLFVGSLTVTLLTSALTGAAGMNGEGDLWLRLGHGIVALIAFAPMAAAVAIVAAPDRDTLPKRAVTAVSLGSAVATAAILLARVPQGASLSQGLALMPFYLVLFALLFALALLPLLLVARPFISHRPPLIVAALICSPVPVLAGAYIDHVSLAMCLEALRHAPLSLAAWSLPFVTGAIGVGWHLPTRGRREPCAHEV